MKATCRQIVSTDKAPSAIGPYSQAIKTDSLLFISGQLAIDAATGDLLIGDIQAETRQALLNLKNILQAAGSSLEQVVKTTLFTKNMEDFTRINQVYAQYFNATLPARAAVQVAAFPKNADIEIETIISL